MQKLKDDEIQNYLEQVEGWTVDDGILKKDFGIKGFRTALEFMNMLAPIAEKLDHHPDWSNSYNRVVINLTTHGARGLTKNDFKFAKEADRIAKLLRS